MFAQQREGAVLPGWVGLRYIDVTVCGLGWRFVVSFLWSIKECKI